MGIQGNFISFFTWDYKVCPKAFFWNSKFCPKVIHFTLLTDFHTNYFYQPSFIIFYKVFFSFMIHLFKLYFMFTKFWNQAIRIYFQKVIPCKRYQMNNLKVNLISNNIKGLQWNKKKDSKCLWILKGNPVPIIFYFSKKYTPL